MSAAPLNPASTPCVQVCVIDPDSGLCTGCGRTLDEIAAWGSLDEPSRLAIMAQLAARLSDARPVEIPGRGAQLQEGR
jgi:predicted Fe-S protein YdhL (DUF1289 family)